MRPSPGIASSCCLFSSFCCPLFACVAGACAAVWPLTQHNATQRISFATFLVVFNNKAAPSHTSTRTLIHSGHTPGATPARPHSVGTFLARCSRNTPPCLRRKTEPQAPGTPCRSSSGSCAPTPPKLSPTFKAIRLVVIRKVIIMVTTHPVLPTRLLVLMRIMITLFCTPPPNGPPSRRRGRAI
jgi:hypothetical protein